MKCPDCGTRLLVLYYRERKKNRLYSYPIEAKYCRGCKKPTILQKLNWFNGE